jgi:hypothetical protein
MCSVGGFWVIYRRMFTVPFESAFITALLNV